MEKSFAIYLLKSIGPLQIVRGVEVKVRGRHASQVCFAGNYYTQALFLFLSIYLNDIVNLLFYSLRFGELELIERGLLIYSGSITILSINFMLLIHFHLKLLKFQIVESLKMSLTWISKTPSFLKIYLIL